MAEKIVYSTRSGDLRKQTQKSTGRAISKPTNQQDIRILRDKKGRKGKVVTVATGFALTEKDLKTLAKTLKATCGSGGTFKINEDGSQVVEVQGDHRTKVMEKLKKLGYKVKLAGG